MVIQYVIAFLVGFNVCYHINDIWPIYVVLAGASVDFISRLITRKY